MIAIITLLPYDFCVSAAGKCCLLKLCATLFTPFSHSSCSEAESPGHARSCALTCPALSSICRAAQKLGLGIRMQRDTDGLAIFDGKRFVMQQVSVSSRGLGFTSAGTSRNFSHMHIALWLHRGFIVTPVHERGP